MQLDSIDPTSNCECCQPEDTKELKTTLTCVDGKTWAQIVRVPTSCSCSPCIGSLVDNQLTSQEPNQSHPAEEDLLQLQQENQEEQQHSESLTQQVLEQLQKPKDEALSEILQQQRQGRGDVAPRNSDGGQKLGVTSIF